MNRIDICKNTIQSIKDYITTPEKLEPHLQKKHFVRKRKLSLFQVITALYFKSLHALLVNSMLDDAAKLLSIGEKPIIHSDRGVHYRWPGWIDRMEKNGFQRKAVHLIILPVRAYLEELKMRCSIMQIGLG